ncbi:unnamed protein product [Gadus morhua 'NCC']
MALNEMSSQHEARLSDLDNRASGTSQLLAPCSVKCHTPGVSEEFERRRSTVQLIALVAWCGAALPGDTAAVVAGRLKDALCVRVGRMYGDDCTRMHGYDRVSRCVLGKPTGSLSAGSQQCGLPTQVYRAILPPWSHQLQPPQWTDRNTLQPARGVRQPAPQQQRQVQWAGVRDHSSTENPFVRNSS